MLRAVRPSLRRAVPAPAARGLIAQPAQLPNKAPPAPLPTALKQNNPETKAAAEHMAGLVKNLNSLRAKAREGGGKATLEKWKSRGQGKLGARER